MKAQAKRKLAALSALLLLFAACAGGGDTAAGEIDPLEAARSILDTVEFQDSMVQADEGAAENYYRLDDTVEDYAVFMSGSRATAEEVAVLRMRADTDLDTARAILEKRVEDQIFNFEDYVPAEMVKLRDPVIVTGGRVAILVLADDTDSARKAAEALLQ